MPNVKNFGWSNSTQALINKGEKEIGEFSEYFGLALWKKGIFVPFTYYLVQYSEIWSALYLASELYSVGGFALTLSNTWWFFFLFWEMEVRKIHGHASNIFQPIAKPRSWISVGKHLKIDSSNRNRFIASQERETWFMQPELEFGPMKMCFFFLNHKGQWRLLSLVVW